MVYLDRAGSRREMQSHSDLSSGVLEDVCPLATSLIGEDGGCAAVVRKPCGQLSVTSLTMWARVHSDSYARSNVTLYMLLEKSLSNNS